jgi:hypothetical protein
MADSTRYRRVDFVGARILQAREMLKLQRIDRGFDDSNNPVAFELGAVYREGATMNVTVGISNKDVTLSATDGSKPMLIFVRGKWEKIKNGEAPTITFIVGETNLYLNWVLKKITSAQDATLIDITTLESAADMGELQLSISKTDTSAVALAGDEFEKNTTPLTLFVFTHVGATMTLNSPINAGTGDKGNVKDQALADLKTAGLVHLSTGTSDGKAVADDDSRLTDARSPLAGSVVDASVRLPVNTGNTNADGTDEYVIGADPGGISAVKIILLSAKQTLEAGWNWLKSKILAVESAFNGHKTADLGLVNTHPMPTAVQVGAAPLSHVGLPLGLATSHPALATMDTGGFRLVRNGAVVPPADDFAYGVQEGVDILAGFTHDGDAFSKLADVFTSPASDGDGALATNGVLGHLSTLAAVVSQHVSKVSHKNPHGLTAGDIGAASVGYVDTQDQNILSSALGFAELLGSISVRKVSIIAPHGVNVWDDAGWGPGESFRSQGSVTAYQLWTIFTFGGRFELGISMGTLHHGVGITLPPADVNGSWPAANIMACASMADYMDKNDLNEPSWSAGVASMGQTSDGAGGFKPTTISAHINNSAGNRNTFATVVAIAWRFITAPPVLISLSPASGATGATITITGRNFGSVIGNADVTFGGVAATVTSCMPTQIQCTVPAGAALGGITVAVTVAARAGINTLTFTKV